MKVTYLDLATGKTASEKGVSLFNLTQNNWTCDCNRMLAFGINSNSDTCAGARRFIVIEVEVESEDNLTIQPEEVIRLANVDYFDALQAETKG